MILRLSIFNIFLLKKLGIDISRSEYIKFCKFTKNRKKLNTENNYISPQSINSSDHSYASMVWFYDFCVKDGKFVTKQNTPSVDLSMYSFASPRIFNRVAAQNYDKVVPDSFRIVNHSDVIPTLPFFFYKHIGTEVIIDGNELSGSLVIDPSFLERRLIIRRKKWNNKYHSIELYRAGIESCLDLQDDDEFE